MSRIGVFVCWCGENIARTVDVQKVVDAVAELPGVRCAQHYKYMCADPGQAMIREKIAAEKLDGVVVASCSPHMHLKTFRRAVATAGLNSTCSKWPTSASNAVGCITTAT
jgi:heterodisulfide reductase subunit A